ncbi:DUF2517 family protein [Alteromonas lipolytica]
MAITPGMPAMPPMLLWQDTKRLYRALQRMLKKTTQKIYGISTNSNEKPVHRQRHQA